jgi:class 3 adenylate cyclase/tetratricopeptide (TPR) repeat protein
MRCSNCGSENPIGKRFCGDCGAPLDGRAPIPTRELLTPLPGERRHLTVLFCDLVNSTSIATQLDPEEWREVVATYHRAAAEAIERFGGYIAQYLGDGVMAYFGWPEAHENDAERAARAGLAILESISRLNEQPLHAKLAARVGIHSGAVVVGAGAGKEAEVFGDVPNIAARLQAIAEPGTVLITGHTHRLVAGLFEVEERGAQPLKGVDQPVELFRVLRPSGARRRLSSGSGLIPFTGRKVELRLLDDLWQRVRHGEGQVVTVLGEPGIGKSRLIRQFRDQIAGGQHIWLESAGDQLAQSTPFHAVTELLQQQISSNGSGNAGKSIERLASLLEAVGLKAKQALPLIAPLLNLPVPKNYPPVPAAPEEQRRQLLASLSRWAMGIAETQPAIMVLEDLQWGDASTVEFVKLLAEQGANAALMQIYTARSGFECPWPTRPQHIRLTLDRLSDCEAHEMVESVAPDKGLPPEMVATVVQRATGIPLFVEELTRDLLERGQYSTPREIPATLHDSLTARLDRLGPARELAQIGAVIGREFSRELLRLVANVSEQELQLALDNLVSADLLHMGRSEPEKSYSFKHALVQDAAYNTLLKSRRRELHQKIAELLEERFPESARSAPELLAHHCTEASLIAQAVRYWRKSARKAIERSANAEAIAQLRKGLELIQALPLTSERLMEEVRLQMALTTPLIATQGYTSQDVERACNRALELCQQVGDVPELFAVLGGLNSIYFNRGELEIALELGRRMLRLAETQRDPTLLLWAHYSLGFTFASQSIPKSARDHLERSITLYDPRRGGSYGYVQDPGPTAIAMLAHVIYQLGYPDQALESIREALALARDLSHPFTLAWVLGNSGQLYWRRGEKMAARELWEEAATLCVQQGFKGLLAGAYSWLAFTMVEQGQCDEGIAKLHDALDSFIDAQSMGDRPFSLALLALAQGKAGQIDQGLVTMNDALALAHKIKEGHLGDFYLFRGQLLLMKNTGGFRKAKQCFSTALELAQKQKAKSDELRAAIPLAKLLVQQGRRQQAHSMLKKIYNWFTEGFDTADLKEAKVLLDELST